MDRGRRRATEDLRRAGAECRRARRTNGLTLLQVGTAAGMSASQVSRIERRLLTSVSHLLLVCIGEAVGLDVRLATYPGADPLRDSGQLALADRFRPRLHPSLPLDTEVPLPTMGDQRAWDGYLRGLARPDGTGSGLPVEFESRLDDFQAQTRRLWLKARDAGEPFVILVVADTQRNRAAIRAAESAVLESFPVPQRRALAALREGRHPGGSALIVL